MFTFEIYTGKEIVVKKMGYYLIINTDELTDQEIEIAVDYLKLDIDSGQLFPQNISVLDREDCHKFKVEN